MGAPSSSALPPGALGHAGEPEHGPGTKPKGVRGEARQVAGAAERSQAHSGDRHPLRRQRGYGGPGGPPPAAAAPPPLLLPGLCCGSTGEFHYPSGPSVLRETGMLTKRSFGERMDTYSMVHPEHGILLSTKQK